jgi:DNA-directed RNA polymerase specialized sigma24 family protein
VAQTLMDDPVRRYLAAKPEEEADELDRLVRDLLSPTINSIVRSRLVIASVSGGRRAEEDAEDVQQQALIAVITKLRECKSAQNAAVIANLKGYAAITAHHACDGYFRKRFPVRSKVANQVRFVLKNQPGLACWQSSDGMLVGGYEAWRDQPPRADAQSLDSLRTKPAEAAQKLSQQLDPAKAAIAEIVAAAFNLAGQPIPIDLLTTLVAEFRGEKDQTRAENPAGSEEGPSPLEQAASTEIGADQKAMLREYLTMVWEEVRLLPTRQAQALLLNLRDQSGRGIIDLLLVTKTATPQQIADLLDMTFEALCDAWDGLPWEDAKIAEYLGLKPIDVSNLRSVARRRLERRLKDLAA